MPWCGTYGFAGGTYLFNCESTAGLLTSVEFLADWYSSIGSTLTKDIDYASESTESQSTERSTAKSVRSSATPTGSRSPDSTSTGPAIIIATSVADRRVLSGGAIAGIAVGGAIVLVAIAAGIIVACCYRHRRRRRHREDHQSAAAQALMPRPPATFDPAQGPPQELEQREKPYSAFQPSYLHPQSPYSDQAGGSPSPKQLYDPSQELSHRPSSVSTAVSPHPLHLDDGPNVPKPQTTGYFTPAPPAGFSELSEGGGAMVKDPSGGGVPMQLRAGSPPSQFHSSVHEVPATTPRAEGERWELPSR